MRFSAASRFKLSGPWSSSELCSGYMAHPLCGCQTLMSWNFLFDTMRCFVPERELDPFSQLVPWDLSVGSVSTLVWEPESVFPQCLCRFRIAHSSWSQVLDPSAAACPAAVCVTRSRCWAGPSPAARSSGALLGQHPPSPG